MIRFDHKYDLHTLNIHVQLLPPILSNCVDKHQAGIVDCLQYDIVIFLKSTHV